MAKKKVKDLLDAIAPSATEESDAREAIAAEEDEEKDWDDLTGRSVRTVKAGDTLGDIAEELYGSVSDYERLAAENAIEDPNSIEPGQKIYYRPRAPELVMEESEVREDKQRPAHGSKDIQTSDDMQERIKKHEKKMSKAYPDKVKENGKWVKKATSVGYGYNMTAYPAQAKEEFEEVGADYARVLTGKDTLTDEQIDSLFEKSLGRAKADAEAYLEDLDTYPKAIQEALIEMAFQMGGGALSEFKKTKKYLQERDWEKAADEMLDSEWAKQTATRAKAVSNAVRNAEEDSANPLLELF